MIIFTNEIEGIVCNLLNLNSVAKPPIFKIPIKDLLLMHLLQCNARSVLVLSEIVIK